jgi:diguanylate cyclase (GGDEF)-like protein
MSEGRFTSIDTSRGLAGGQIWAVHADREGSVWVGSWVGGMNRLRNRPFVVFGTPEGLSHDNVRSVLHARNGVTWVATSGGGLNRIENGRITVLGKKDGLPTDEISSLHEDHNGALWVGTYTSGVVRLSQGRIETYGTSQGLPNLDVRALFEDSKGTLWAGTRAGLARFNGKEFTAVREKGAPTEGVTTILEDRSGAIWFGTPGQGLVHYRDGVFKTLTEVDGLVSNWIMALYEDAASTLWIGTNGRGMNRLRDGRVISIRTDDGLWDGIAQTILEDHTGHFWMTCNRGFYRVSRSELDAFAEGRLKKVASTSFGPGDALRSTIFAGGLQQAGAVDAKGQLWLPSANGLVIVDPAHLPRSAEPPVVHLDSVVIDGVSVLPRADVVLPPGSVPLSIRYTAMTLLNADRVRFRYQMEGMTHDWVDAGRTRDAAFPALPNGNFRFRVTASVDGKHWSEAEQALSITVKPYFYQTYWFIVLTCAGTLASIVALFRLRTHNLRVRHDEMELLVAQRTEELRLANEHLSQLSFIDALTGLANRRRFDEVLEAEWRRACRDKSRLAIVIADIDGFKQYNDTLGHPEGDRCLAAVAGVFKQSVGRVGDLAARYGGEEFIVLLSAADHAAAFSFAQGLRAACEGLAIPHPATPTGPVVTISAGVASCIPADENSAAELVAQADSALYEAKKDGRNRVH